LLSGSAAAAGIALINCFGTLGGFVGPYMLGWIKDQFHTQVLGLYILAGFLFLCAALTLWAVPSRSTSASSTAQTG
jgi:ACS family tartrate transporter-like MFS transporter